MTELFCGPDAMMLYAQAADVRVIVTAAFAQRDDVVGCHARGHDAFGQAISTKRFGIKASEALRHACPTSQSPVALVMIAPMCLAHAVLRVRSTQQLPR
jgi:hypothetical protein